MALIRKLGLIFGEKSFAYVGSLYCPSSNSIQYKTTGIISFLYWLTHQNLFSIVRWLRIIGFGTKEGLIAQVKKKNLKINNFYFYLQLLRDKLFFSFPTLFTGPVEGTKLKLNKNIWLEISNFFSTDSLIKTYKVLPAAGIFLFGRKSHSIIKDNNLKNH